MNRKRLLLLILALLLSLVVPAAAISLPGPGTATKITITPSDIYVGELVTAQVTPGSDILRNVYYIFNWSGVTGSVTHRIDTGTDSVPAATSGNGSVSVELFYVHDNGYADTAMADFEVKTLPVASITITPATSRLKVGSSTELTAKVLPEKATNQDLIWNSQNGVIAGVDVDGKVTGFSPGTATITADASDGSGVSGTATVTVYVPVSGITLDPPSYSLFRRGTIQYGAQVVPDNASDQGVSWLSSHPAIATVNDGGLATAISAGTATITATAKDGSGVSGTTKLTVLPPAVPVTGITLDPATASVLQGKTVAIKETVLPTNASDPDVSWSSSHPAIATVNTDGTVTGISPGTATITLKALDGSGVSGSATVTVQAPVVLVTSITLNPATATLLPGETKQLSASVLPANATNKGYTWASGDTAIATVNDSGLVTAVAPGTIGITATARDASGVKGQSTVTVRVPVTSITVTPATATLAPGKTQQLSATVLPTNATNKSYTWSSSHPDILAVDNMGLVTGVSPGTATITAKALDDSGVSGSATVTVQPPGDFTYDEHSPGEIRILSYIGNAAEVQVPSHIEGKSVTAIGADAFAGKTGITKVSLQESIRKIENSAFLRCSGLRSVNLPSSLLTLGESVFNGCGQLNGISLPAGLTSIGRGAFYECTALTAISIPDSVSELGGQVFRGCTALSQVQLPAKLSAIPNSLFASCKSLRGISLPDGLTSIGAYAFQDAGLTAITIPDSVSQMGEHALSYCYSLSQVRLPAKLTSIPARLFQNCWKLINVSVPSGVTTISDEAFRNCKELQRVTIRAGVSSLGSNVFMDSPAVTIYGDVPSAAKDYADGNSIPFVDLAGGLPGDANGDKEVDLLDATCLTDFLVKGTLCPNMKNADANQSGGQPDIQDLVAIINMII